MERIHETRPNIYIYIYIYNREIVDNSNHFLIFHKSQVIDEKVDLPLSLLCSTTGQDELKH